MVTVADYRCVTLADATAALEGDGFTLGTVTAQPAGYTAAEDSIVIEQAPSPGQKRAPGTPIDLTVYDPARWRPAHRRRLSRLRRRCRLQARRVRGLATLGRAHDGPRPPGQPRPCATNAVRGCGWRRGRRGRQASTSTSHGGGGAGRAACPVPDGPGDELPAAPIPRPAARSGRAPARSAGRAAPGSADRRRGRRDVLPARSDLVADERQTPAVETAEADPRGDRAAVMAARRAARRGPVADPAPRSLGLGRLAMRTPPRHGAMVAAVADAVTSPARASRARSERGPRPRPGRRASAVRTPGLADRDDRPVGRVRRASPCRR